MEGGAIEGEGDVSGGRGYRGGRGCEWKEGL